MPMREQGLGEDDWPMENRSLGKLGVEVGLLQSTLAAALHPSYPTMGPMLCSGTSQSALGSAYRYLCRCGGLQS